MKAIEAARECARVVETDWRMTTEDNISNTLSLPQLFAIVEAAERVLNGLKEEITNWDKYPQFRSATIGGMAAHRAIIEEALTAYHTAQKENRK